MTQVITVSATTAGYAMDAMRPARRVSTADHVRDTRVEAEKNERRTHGEATDDIQGLLPPVPLALDLNTNHQQQYPVNRDEVEDAYKEI
ncbi:hypothetical protein [Rhizobium oryzicola]|uniref:Uncharacterized protein n=1 Tax=Rhizobium oryzicola TaxID=1232668 RepID=A0ABT8SZA0_9HYPH|nr:hypothetical protein [Rhizobium oryzicola]MDO1583765.1 hypothetical protein [Rhizobium oryzicola]